MIATKKIKSGILPLALCLTIGLFFLELETVTAAVQNSLKLCAGTLIPGLFPFMLLTDVLLSSEEGSLLLEKIGKPFSRLFGCSHEGGGVFLIGILFGFPLGAKAIAKRYESGALTQKEAEYLFLFSNNASPAFLIGGVGLGMLNCPKCGVFLFGIQFLSSVLIGLSLRNKMQTVSRKAVHFSFTPPSAFSLTSSMQRSLQAIFSVCGYVVFFSVLSEVLSPIIPSLYGTCLLKSLLEIGSACAYLTKNIETSLLLPFLSFTVCFSGTSVYLQALDFRPSQTFNTSFYIPVKLLQGGMAFLLTWLGISFFG